MPSLYDFLVSIFYPTQQQTSFLTQRYLGKDILLHIISFLEMEDIQFLREASKEYADLITSNLTVLSSTTERHLYLDRTRRAYPKVRIFKNIALHTRSLDSIPELEGMTNFHIHISRRRSIWDYLPREMFYLGLILCIEELERFYGIFFENNDEKKDIIRKILKKFFDNPEPPPDYRIAFSGEISLILKPESIAICSDIKLSDIKHLSKTKYLTYIDCHHPDTSFGKLFSDVRIGKCSAPSFLDFPDLEVLTLSEKRAIEDVMYEGKYVTSNIKKLSKLRNIFLKCSSCYKIYRDNLRLLFPSCSIGRDKKEVCRYHRLHGYSQ